MATRSSYNPGYSGYPALFFLETLHQDRGDKKLMDRMWSLHARYSYLRGWLWDAEGNLKKGVSEKIPGMMADLKTEIDNMFDQYQDVYEGETCTPQEKQFMLVLRAVRERVDLIGATSGIVDKQTPDEEVYKV